ncbi:MAG: hypothetical protein HQM08_23880 [Candidatus Riflebacteria bacterium]|nr:hypothetical protein [Candidatus Riflebacteria bacterium]
MPSDLACEKFFDELLSQKELSSELSKHLQNCANCRGILETVKNLKQTSTAFKIDSLAKTRKRILETTFPVAEGVKVSGKGPILAGTMALIIVGGVFSLLHSPSVHQKEIIPIENSSERISQLASVSSSIDSQTNRVIKNAIPSTHPIIDPKNSFTNQISTSTDSGASRKEASSELENGK